MQSAPRRARASRTRVLGVLACVLVALTIAPSDGAAKTKSHRTGATEKQETAERSKTSSRSVGSPNEGKLVGGKRISSSKSLRLVGSLQFAMPELVSMLEKSSERVAKRYPGSVLTVGDLSRKGGGDVGGHRSHESGRDADVGFYLTRGNKPYLPRRFATIDPTGNVVGYPSVKFDDARNWALVEAWLTDPKARVLQIFVARHLKARLLAYAARTGVSASLRMRAAETLLQPSRALPHDNHFHVRIACQPGSKDCVNFGKRKAKPHPKRPLPKKAGGPKLQRRASPTAVHPMSSSNR